MLKSAEKSHSEGGSAVFNSQSANVVSLLAVMHNAFLYLYFLSQRQQQHLYFVLQESVARHYLCDGHKDFVSFEKRRRQCRAISSLSSGYCGTPRVRDTEFSTGSYCPSCTYLTTHSALAVLSSEMMCFFCSKQIHIRGFREGMKSPASGEKKFGCESPNVVASGTF